jgi:hypothetical protein
MRMRGVVMQCTKMTLTSTGKRWKSEKQKETNNKTKPKKGGMAEEQRKNMKRKWYSKERTARNGGRGYRTPKVG